MFPGSARASRAGDRALAVANFLAFAVLKLEGTHFGEGAEMCTRGACAPRKIRARTQRGIVDLVRSPRRHGFVVAS
ncbi:MAG: hypothetical protein DMF32_08385 [Verrucomicrobia bacterium]|nr:MAG: hypothetical protein DMF32_08385 [Verrucomicrobiota bacterium]